MIVAVVFSMDRAMQCDSLLRSMYANCVGLDRIVVIARATSDLHATAYDRLSERLSPPFEVHFETRGASVHLADAIEGASHVCINVDDQFYYNKADFGWAARVLDAEQAFVFSWRLGAHATHAPLADFGQLAWRCNSNADPAGDYGYVFHSDGALYDAGVYKAHLNLALPDWQQKAYIPNALEAEGVARTRMAGFRHVGPVEPSCITWQLNKQSTTKGLYGAPWVSVPETELDAMAQAFLAGKRVDNDRLLADKSWIRRFTTGTSRRHVRACGEAAQFYAGLIR